MGVQKSVFHPALQIVSAGEKRKIEALVLGLLVVCENKV